ncbi:MafI family immunity protein [Glycomyces sp. NPDC049804]|uniref:MafI family immunity protein n=1 Tax=Glycomyces sp. NPDC049804 TaxID=3154363 RepID=UPI003440F6A7
MNSQEISAGLIRLLRQSPISREEVTEDVLDLVRAGEEGLALELICAWIHEDELEITSDYFNSLETMGDELGLEVAVRNLSGLVSDSGGQVGIND